MSNPYSGGAAPKITTCKCCHGLARLTGLVDFSKCGRDTFAGRKVEPYVGWPIYYYHCDSCGFSFTRALDHWTNIEFTKYIYNMDYILHDPAYNEHRPRSNANLIDSEFSDFKELTTILDYGSGAGYLEQLLLQRGFMHVDSYDPFSSPARPQGKYNMITCFEVFEHTTDPHALMADIVAHLTDDGAVFFSTWLCTPEDVELGLANWWYCAPRSGHISFYGRETLIHLGNHYGLHHAWFDNARHIFHRDQKPGWLRKHLPG